MICRICGINGNGQAFDKWAKPTFMDWDKLHPGQIICQGCLFWFNERSEKLTQRVGKEKPQRMRNYSHFMVGGEWIPLSKGDKVRMQALLLGDPFPELAAIAISGQKHIVFRARRNPLGNKVGWVQIEEQMLYLVPGDLRMLLGKIEQLYTTFNKSEIETGNYAGYRVIKFGLERWNELEQQIALQRGGLLFLLALFLAQKGDRNGRSQTADNRPAGDSVAGDTGGLQEPIQTLDLAAVREPNQERGVHEQSGQMYQFPLL